MTIIYELLEPNTRLDDFAGLVEAAISDSRLNIEKYDCYVITPKTVLDQLRGLGCKIECSMTDNDAILIALAGVALDFGLFEDSAFFEQTANDTLKRVILNPRG